MPVPQVVIVGRPNVGKSSLLNWLARRRIAIVDDQPGVTRDRVTFLVEGDDRFFELVDTGGMGGEDVDNLTAEVKRQIDEAIAAADLILLVVDAQTGVTALDEYVARQLRRVTCPVLCVVNKADNDRLESEASEFYRLGHDQLLAVSTKANRHRSQLLEWILDHLPETDETPVETPVMKLAIVGRRNVGKSTFVNALAQTERMIVSEVPGTTRDSVDVRFELDGHVFVAIDTPGLRRGKSVRSDLDFYSTRRAQRSIRRADVVLLMLDAAQRLSRVDKQLCNYIADQYKPCIFVVNKWDLLYGQLPTERWVTYLRENFPTLAHVPIAFITARTGKNVKKLINHAQLLFKQSRQRVGTGVLNRLVQRALELHPPPLYHHRPPKIYYAAQVAIQPPTIVLTCNNPRAFDATYRRYLLGVLRDQLSFGEVPIRLYWHQRQRSGAKGKAEPVSDLRPDQQLG